jgi:hypothetical protein
MERYLAGTKRAGSGFHPQELIQAPDLSLYAYRYAIMAV